MKRSDLLVIAGLGIAGYYAYTKFSKTKQDNSIYDTTIQQFKAPGQLVNDAINTTSSGLAFLGQSAASLLSNNQAVPIIKQAGNVASTLINPVGALTDAVIHVIGGFNAADQKTPATNISTPSISSNTGKTQATLTETLATHTITNAGNTELGFYSSTGAGSGTFISASTGQGMSIAPQFVSTTSTGKSSSSSSKSVSTKTTTATPFATTTTKPTTTLPKDVSTGMSQAPSTKVSSILSKNTKWF